MLLCKEKNISLDPRANFFSQPLIRDTNNLKVSQIKQSSHFSIHAEERYQMSGLAWSETPFSKFGPYFEQLESKLAFLKLHFRRCRCYSVELYYGAVLGDTFLPSFPPNVVTANGRSDSVQISTQRCNSTRYQSIFIRNVRMANPRGYAL